jgi:hypothetical protein
MSRLAQDPLDFGIPEQVVEAARATAGKRSPEEATAILDYFRSADAEILETQAGIG